MAILSILFVDPKKYGMKSRPGNTRNTRSHGDRRVQQCRLLEFPGIMRPGILYIALEELIFFLENCMTEAPRYTVSEWHFGKFPDSDDFQCWSVNFKTEVCVSTPFPELTMS